MSTEIKNSIVNRPQSHSSGTVRRRLDQHRTEQATQNRQLLHVLWKSILRKLLNTEVEMFLMDPVPCTRYLCPKQDSSENFIPLEEKSVRSNPSRHMKNGLGGAMTVEKREVLLRRL